MNNLLETQKNQIKYLDTKHCVCKQKGLTKKQIVYILNEWAYDAKCIEIAENENMIGDPSSGLEKILDAIRMIDKHN